VRSRFERLLAARWRSVFLVCVLIALSGVAVILWARIDAGDRRADEIQLEADRRGQALSTLARDVRALRAQVSAGGGTRPVRGGRRTDRPDPGARGRARCARREGRARGRRRERRTGRHRCRRFGGSER